MSGIKPNYYTCRVCVTDLYKHSKVIIFESLLRPCIPVSSVKFSKNKVPKFWSILTIESKTKNWLMSKILVKFSKKFNHYLDLFLTETVDIQKF